MYQKGCNITLLLILSIFIFVWFQLQAAMLDCMPTITSDIGDGSIFKFLHLLSTLSDVAIFYVCTYLPTICMHR